MILGIGVDLLNIDRVKKLYSKYNNNFAKKILSTEELNEYKNSKQKENFLGKRFSCKESFSKAIGTGIGRGINFNEITIKNDIMGKPIVFLSNIGISKVEKIFKTKIDKIKIDLSITDEDNYINTFIIISKIN